MLLRGVTHVRKFQFLIGAIGSVYAIICGVDVFDVSIPYWCDWKLPLALLNHSPRSFQFLIGAIGRTIN